MPDQSPNPEASFSQKWLEKHCPELVRDINFWSRFGAERAQKAAPSQPAAPPEWANCIRCHAVMRPRRLDPRARILPGHVPLIIHLCDACDRALAEDEKRDILHYFSAGAAAGATKQLEQNAALLASERAWSAALQQRLEAAQASLGAATQSAVQDIEAMRRAQQLIGDLRRSGRGWALLALAGWLAALAWLL